MCFMMLYLGFKQTLKFFDCKSPKRGGQQNEHIKGWIKVFNVLPAAG